VLWPQAINDALADALCSPSGQAATQYPLSVLNPSDVVFIASTLTTNAVNVVANCLRNIEVPSAAGGGSRVVSLSYAQYQALVEAYLDHPAIYAFLRLLTGHGSADLATFRAEEAQSEGPVSRSVARKELHALRCGGILHHDMQFGTYYCHPMQTAMFEMERHLDALCPSSTYANENSLSEEQAECQTAFLSSLELLHSYDHIRMIRQTPKTMRGASHIFGGMRPEDEEDDGQDEGDTLQALCCVDDAMIQLREVLGTEVSEYKDEVSVGPPVKLRSELLIERCDRCGVLCFVVLWCAVLWWVIVMCLVLCIVLCAVY
jgi:hypothetical protein